MLKLKVKKEFLPTRCEICHKEDCFDPNLDFCKRCNSSLTKIICNEIESLPPEEILYDWQIITLKDVQIIWLKLSLNFLAFVTVLYLTPLIGNFINLLPPHVFGLVGFGAAELLIVFVIFLVMFGSKKSPEIVQKLINFIKSFFY